MSTFQPSRNWKSCDGQGNEVERLDTDSQGNTGYDRIEETAYAMPNVEKPGLSFKRKQPRATQVR
jgi:hypothetical protein